MFSKIANEIASLLPALTSIPIRIPTRFSKSIRCAAARWALPPHDALPFCNAAIAPPHQSVKLVRPGGRVRRCPQPDLLPPLFMEPSLAALDQLSANPPAFVFRQHGDNPELAVSPVGHAEA